MPPQWFGTNDKFLSVWEEMEWVKNLPKNTYLAMYLRIPSQSDYACNLPVGHSLYVVTFLDEPFDHLWLLEQCRFIKEPIIVLNDGSVYDFPLPSNVYFFQFHSWHYQLDKIMSWFPERKPRSVHYKASAICNRITQSKMLIFSALMKNIDRSHCLIKLSRWLEEKNVHYRDPTGIDKLDDLGQYFYKNWLGKEIIVDTFNNIEHNKQSNNSNPWQNFYVNTALHFTNESYHYSYMNDELGQYIRPGPCLSEKTYKCLVSGTPFISVAQFDVYQSFENLGFKFDYGEIDLSWDKDPGNLTRMLGTICLIEKISQMNITEIESMTKNSTDHNFDHVWSGNFSKLCRSRNKVTIEQILARFS
jgi:hypothetical protein